MFWNLLQRISVNSLLFPLTTGYLLFGTFVLFSHDGPLVFVFPTFIQFLSEWMNGANRGSIYCKHMEYYDFLLNLTSSYALHFLTIRYKSVTKIMTTKANKMDFQMAYLYY